MVKDASFDAVVTVVRNDRSGHRPCRLVTQHCAGGVGALVGRGVAGHFDGLGAAGHDDPLIAISEGEAASAGRGQAFECDADVHFTGVELLASFCGHAEHEVARFGVGTDGSIAFQARGGVGWVQPAKVDLNVTVITDDDVDVFLVVRGVAVLVGVDAQDNQVLTNAGRPGDVGTQGAEGGGSARVDRVGGEGGLVTGSGVVADCDFIGPRKVLSRGILCNGPTGAGRVGQIDVQRVGHVGHVTRPDVLHDRLKSGGLADEHLVTATCRRTARFRRFGDAEDVDVRARASAGLFDAIFGFKFVGWNSREQADEQQRHEKHGGHVSHLGPSTMWLKASTTCAVYILWDG